MNHVDPRYLEAKRTLDSRARSPRVRDQLRTALPADPTILEIGCGTGTLLPRLIEWGIDAGTYRGIDAAEQLLAFARDVRPAEFRREGRSLVEQDRGFTVANLSVTFEQGDGLEALAASTDVDLIIAQAFADLVPLSTLVSGIESALAPGGLAYLPITFDGGTIFQPDHAADQAVERAYHEWIDAQSGRDVHAGRHLADAFGRRKNGVLVGMAASDWVLRPREGNYPADEAYLLRKILDFIDQAISHESVDGTSDWLATRRNQLAAEELTYVAHQYDLLYKTAGPDQKPAVR